MPTLNDVDSEGGDPPCWAHFFDDEAGLDKDHGADAGTSMAAGLRVDATAMVESRRADPGGVRAGSSQDTANDRARDFKHHPKRV